MLAVPYITSCIAWPLMLLCLKYLKHHYLKPERKTKTNICEIFFLNKDVELINVPHIFHDPSMKACLPVEIKFFHPTVVQNIQF